MKRKQKKIFIVDDSQYNLKAIDRKVRSEIACDTYLFSDPNKALDAMSVHRPDLVLTDYRLDHHQYNSLTGEQLLLKIKKKFPKIPVLVYSSSSNEFLALRLIALGAENFVPRSCAFYEEIGAISAFHINPMKHPLEQAKPLVYSMMAYSILLIILVSLGLMTFSFSAFGSIILFFLVIYSLHSLLRRWLIWK